MKRRIIAIDGEGAGRDVAGRQQYQLLRWSDENGEGDHMWMRDGALSTIECLEFLLALPRSRLLVGFHIGYDVTMLLRDLPDDRLDDLFRDRGEDAETGRSSPYTWFDPKGSYRHYGIDWLPGQFFRVCRIDGETKRAIKHTARTWNDMAGHLRGHSFIAACRLYGIGSEDELHLLAEGKAARGRCASIGRRQILYCEIETKLMARLGRALADVIEAAGFKPQQLRGPGQLATQLCRLHGVPRCDAAGPPRYPLSPKWATAVARAYFGGRIECQWYGEIPGPIVEYDLRSAYPWALCRLPSYTKPPRWRRFTGEPPAGARVYLAEAEFAGGGAWGFLPVRLPDGAILYPLEGKGCWWSPEIEAARHERVSVVIAGGWYAEERGANDYLPWIEELFERRQNLTETAGLSVKSALNSIYGKLAQSVGRAQWHDQAMAGLVTSFVRARLADAIWGDPTAVIALATDAIFARRPLHLFCGGGLGDWRSLSHRAMHVVAPGIHLAGDEFAHRGWAPTALGGLLPWLRSKWRDAVFRRLVFGPPHIDADTTWFIGHRMAKATTDSYESAGSWRTIEMSVGYEWEGKRLPGAVEFDGLAVRTAPWLRAAQPSLPYDPTALTSYKELRWREEAMPDEE